MTIEIELVQPDRTVRLGSDDDPSVREGDLTIHIRAQGRPPVWFDDVLQRALWIGDGTTGLVQLDLTNQIGYHQIVVGDGPARLIHDFRTDSTKATWEQVQAMAGQLARHALTFRRQFLYSMPDGRRASVAVPEIEFGWLRERVDEIVRLVLSIDKRPAMISESRTETSFRGGRVSIPRTLAFLRENPNMLEASDDGPIVIGEKRYWPSAVKAIKRERRTAPQEHQQIAAFLRTLIDACRRLEPTVPHDQRRVISGWLGSLDTARRARIVREHDQAGAANALTPVATRIQQVDARYKTLRALHFEYLRDFSSADYDEQAIRTNIKDVWEIFQAYTAHLIGLALGLSYLSESRGLRDRDRSGRSMASDDIDLYYDILPPVHVLPSWRAASERPADERPDITLHHRTRGLVAIIDAKFRKDRVSDRALNEDLFVLQSYLQSFRIGRGGIAFPSSRREFLSVAGGGYELLEIPISAEESIDSSAEMLIGAVDRLWQPVPASNT